MSNFAMAAAMKKRKRMAGGGKIEKVSDSELQQPNILDESKSAKKWGGPQGKARKELSGTSIGQGTSLKDFGDLEHAKKDAKRALNYQRSIPGPTSGMSGFAEGGEACDDERDADMIARIMHKRKQYSEGGMAANDTPPIADFEPNDFDDLALRDDLNFEYDADNSGDKLGNEKMDEDDKDIISRIMKSSRKKDRMPRPA